MALLGLLDALLIATCQLPHHQPREAGGWGCQLAGLECLADTNRRASEQANDDHTQHAILNEHEADFQLPLLSSLSLISARFHINPEVTRR